MDEHQSAIRQCFSYWDGKWPKDQMAGIIFFNGERITIEEFAEYKKIYDAATK